MRDTADDTISYSPHRIQSTGESQGANMSIPTWRERLPDTCTYPEIMRAMQAQIDDLRRENEFLRVECGLRQIQGYNEGKAALATEERYWPRFAIRLASPGHVQPGRTVVDIEIGGNWIPLISEAGDVFCHIIEPAGIEAILAKPVREAIRALKKGA